jgi:LysR family positive regulator for ilvC
MELRDLQSFLILSSNLNFAQTADICAASPSTITRRIQRLEKELKCELFIRDTQNVQLTTAGIRLKAFASEFIENWNSLKFEFQYLNNTLQGQLKVFCSVTASYLILPNIISLFQKTYPNVELKLETGDSALAVGRVLSKRSDFSIAARPDKEYSNLEYKTLINIPLVFIAPKEHHFNLMDLSRIPIIYPEHGMLRKRVDEWFQAKQIKPNIYAEVAGHEAIVSMVALGCGISIVPKAVVEQSPVSNNIEILNLKPELKPFNVSLCVNKNRFNEKIIEAFWNIVDSINVMDNNNM